MHSPAQDFLSISDLLLKATPSEENGRRFLYMEASNESLDHQGEVVLSKALADSRDYYLRYGNLDLDHKTQLPAKPGEPSPYLSEIGKPVDVKLDGKRTFVKAELYQGDTPIAANANMVWDGVTKLQPAQRWYPSVGGAILDRGMAPSPNGGAPCKTVRAVRWTNIGLSRTPVNLAVPTASTVPFGVLAKSWGAHGFEMSKALEAGYGTDAAALTGGAALRTESQDHRVQSYWDFRDRLAGALRAGEVKPTAPALVDHAASHFGIAKSDAAEWTERFLADLTAARTKRKSS